MWYNATDTKRDGNGLSVTSESKAQWPKNLSMSRSRLAGDAAGHWPRCRQLAHGWWASVLRRRDSPCPFHALHEVVEPGFTADHLFLLGLEGGNDEHT
jgi:hypothetical protein